eukprot:PhM_4_TR2875/c1_g1_i1/m.96960
MPAGDEVTEVEPYHFSGVHHRFITGKVSVTCVKFAHGQDDVLAMGTGVGTVLFCSSLMDPCECGPQLDRADGHHGTVTDIEWTSSNQYLVSCSVDKSIRVWDVNRRVCARNITEVSPCLSLVVVPHNNNLVMVSFNKGSLKIYNLSTGKVLKKTQTKHTVGALTWGPTREVVVAGDSCGHVTLHRTNDVSSEIRKMCSIALSGADQEPVTSVQCQKVSVETAPGRKCRVSTILASVRCSTLFLLHAALSSSSEGLTSASLTIIRRVHIPHTTCQIRSVASVQHDGVCSVSGGEDGAVYIHNLTRLKIECVAKVVDSKQQQLTTMNSPASASPVLCVGWNASETMLACGNTRGELVVWRRAQFDDMLGIPAASMAGQVFSEFTGTTGS